jgi:hypothetical protein
MNHHYKFIDAVKELNDGISAFESWFGFGEPFFSEKDLKFYDFNHYDLVLKPHHIERRIKEKEQQLSNYKSIIKHHEEIAKKIEEEINELKTKIVEK